MVQTPTQADPASKTTSPSIDLYGTKTLEKIDFMAKIAKKQVFRPNFRANFRFCTKFGPIRQSHGQPEMSAKFQPNPTLFEEFVIFLPKTLLVD